MTLLKVLVSLVIAYLVVAFIGSTLDYKSWHWVLRLVYAIWALWIIAAGVDEMD